MWKLTILGGLDEWQYRVILRGKAVVKAFVPKCVEIGC